MMPSVRPTIVTSPWRRIHSPSNPPSSRRQSSAVGAQDGPFRLGFVFGAYGRRGFAWHACQSLLCPAGLESLADVLVRFQTGLFDGGRDVVVRTLVR